MFTALLDTCVLWPSLQRDVLLSLAAEGMYRPAWSSVILAELEYEQAAKLTRRGVAPTDADNRAAHLIQQMRQAFDDAEITGWEGLEGTYGLPDPDDEHVVAAAVVGGAGAIVTLNTKDFPTASSPPVWKRSDLPSSPPTPSPSTRTAPYTPSAPSPTEPAHGAQPGPSTSCSTSFAAATGSMTPSTNSAASSDARVETSLKCPTSRRIDTRSDPSVARRRLLSFVTGPLGLTGGIMLSNRGLRAAHERPAGPQRPGCQPGKFTIDQASGSCSVRGSGPASRSGPKKFPVR